jgi:hypothetical protein
MIVSIPDHLHEGGSEAVLNADDVFKAGGTGE